MIFWTPTTRSLGREKRKYTVKATGKAGQGKTMQLKAALDASKQSNRCVTVIDVTCNFSLSPSCLFFFLFLSGCIKRPKSQRGIGVRARAFTHWSSRGRGQADTRSGLLRSRLGERSISDTTPSPKTKGRHTHTHSPVYTYP